MARLEIRLLGNPEIAVNGVPVGPLPAKLEALLYYLAAAPRSVSRIALAGLLWGERSEQDARMNLRAALQKLPESLAPHLTVNRDWLAFDRASDMSVDLQPFEHALLTFATPEAPAARLERLRAMAGLHRDEFLAGFAPSHAPEFEAWCASERTRLREGAVRLLLEVLRLEKEAGREQDAVETARRTLHLSPGHDIALRELMGALARSGQRNAAIESYERHRRAWRDELGIAPSTETERLADRIVSGDSLVAAAAVPAASAAPAQLLGREREQAMIVALLGGEGMRIVSLTGLGGIGKTRLAQSVMAQVKERFPDGLKFFSIGAMRSGAAVGPAIAAGLGLQLRGGQVSKQIQEFLREKSMLLVLDSFEPVAGTEAVDLLLEIVHAAPGVRCLLTTREALGVAEEAVVAIDGLAYPEGNAAVGEGWRDFAAVQLFVQRAARGYVQFDAQREREGIVRICQRVQGIPLALELAASLARNLPCIEIARAVEHDLETLSRDDASLSPRHRSMARVLACAFDQLSPELQACLARLSVFRGPFRSDAAEAVALGSLRQLSTLIEKSWLRRDPGAGYVLHDVIRQFARGRLAALRIDAAKLDEAHAMHFAAWLSALHDSVRAGDNPVVLDEIRDVLADVVAACEWASRFGQDADFERAFHTLYRYFENRGDFVSVEQFYGPAREALERNRRARKRRLQSIAHCNFGWAFTHMSRYDEGVVELEKAAAKAREAGAELLRGEALRGIALARTMQGRVDEATPLLEECMAICRGDAFGEMATLNVLGVAASFGGVGRGQADYYRQFLEIAEANNHPRGALVAHFNLGDDALTRGDLDAAERHFQRSIELGHSAGNRRNQCMSYANLAAVQQARGDFPGTRRYLDQAWEIARVLGERRLYSFIYQGYAEVDAAERRWPEAEAWARKMIAVADDITWAWSAAFGVALLAQALAETGRRDEALGAIHDLHRRVKDASFEVHHANAAVEAARWILRFQEKDAALAGRTLHALAASGGIDNWVRGRARELLIGEPPATAPEGGAREWMAATVAVLPSA
ncbi:hypothetical protein BWI17_18555 [Betaproteobacteria bacterium GR16-43]|nr:hypothetical protein BWI17_18555 [Betaproteobacteria bacterium GR16-43]